MHICIHLITMWLYKVRLRCTCILLVLIYLITMWVYVQKLDLDVHSYHCY